MEPRFTVGEGGEKGGGGGLQNNFSVSLQIKGKGEKNNGKERGEKRCHFKKRGKGEV